MHASAEAAALAPGVAVRRGKLLAMADAFASAVGRAVEDAAAEALGAEAAAAAAAAADAAALAAAATLPESILANREPYLQGDWRKEPYIPRWATMPRGPWVRKSSGSAGDFQRDPDASSARQGPHLGGWEGASASVRLLGADRDSSCCTGHVGAPQTIGMCGAVGSEVLRYGLG